jgi:stalled ribosome alternative rescue factor ArfA
LASKKPPGSPRKRSGIAASLKFFKPKIVKPKKGKKAYRRKPKHIKAP